MVRAESKTTKGIGSRRLLSFSKGAFNSSPANIYAVLMAVMHISHGIFQGIQTTLFEFLVNLSCFFISSIICSPEKKKKNVIALSGGIFNGFCCCWCKANDKRRGKEGHM